MTWFELYMWTRLDAINTAIGVMTALVWVALVAIVIWRVYLAQSVANAIVLSAHLWSANDTALRRQRMKQTLRTVKVCRRYIMLIAPMAVLLTIGSIAIPTKSDVALIQGMTWATNNADVKAIPDDAVKLIREWLNEARPNRKESKP